MPMILQRLQWQATKKWREWMTDVMKPFTPLKFEFYELTEKKKL